MGGLCVCVRGLCVCMGSTVARRGRDALQRKAIAIMYSVDNIVVLRNI